MPSEPSESAIVVRVRVPPAIERLRRQWDRAAGLGVPAHVTILYPFMPPGELDPAARRVLAGIAAAVEPFDVRFERVGRFPTAVYAVPDPSDPFVRLTEAVVAAFPDFQPYGGAFDAVIPHLTIAESADADQDALGRLAVAAMPFGGRVTVLELLVEGADGRWRPHWRLRLGVRP